MVIRVCAALVGMGLLFAAVPVRAHHAFASEFDINQPITLKGTLTKVEWINPHGWIHVDVPGPNGTVKQWKIETGAPNALLRRGLRASDFPPGMEIVIKGYRAKKAPFVANGDTVTFVDGRDFFLGSSGAGAPSGGAR